MTKEQSDKWPHYFYNIAQAVATKSPCLSRKIGAVLVRDKVVIATGYNGPPRNVSHCSGDRCPRQLSGFQSGEGLHLCPAVHAEQNVISSAAKNGMPTDGAILYLTCEIPCKVCLGMLIDAGIKEIFVAESAWYDELSIRIVQQAGVIIHHYPWRAAQAPDIHSDLR